MYDIKKYIKNIRRHGHISVTAINERIIKKTGARNHSNKIINKK